MERLTYQWNCGYAIDLPNALSGKRETLKWSVSERKRGLRLTGYIPDRLAAYEDTGLEPDDVTDLMAAHGIAIGNLAEYRALGSVDHLRELVQAEQDGRLVLLSFRIGDFVYRVAVRKKYIKHSIHTPYIKRVEIKPENAYKYINEIGKTVFLTPREAEVALKGGDEE